MIRPVLAFAQRSINKTYLLLDMFVTDLAAGAINGTLAEPIGGLRTVTDTNNKISIAAGVLSFATGEAANDAVWYGSITRAAGRSLMGQLIASEATDGIPAFGWDSAASGAILDAIRLGASGALNIVANGATALLVGAYTATTYQISAVMRATGIFWFIKGGAFTKWTLLWSTAAGTAAGFPAVAAGGIASVFTADNIRVPRALWLPVPLASDGFSLPTLTDGLGHAEANGGSGLTWTGATWTVATGKVTNAPTEGTEDVTNGNMETGDPPSSWVDGSVVGTKDGVADERTGGAGSQSLSLANVGVSSGRVVQVLDNPAHTWMYITAWVKRITSTAKVRLATTSDTVILMELTSAITDWTHIFFTGRTTESGCKLVLINNTTSDLAESRYDDVSAKPLTLSTLFRTLTVSSPDVLASVAITLTTGTQAGLITNLDNATTPANFVIAYLDGAGNVKLDKCVAGTYTNLISAAVTYAASAVLRVIKDGTEVRVFYNNLAVGTVQTVSDAAIVDNTIHGLFSTYSANSFDSFVVYARGTANEYSALDNF